MLRRIRERALGRVGGRAAAKLVLIFGAVLALDSADMGAIGAMADRIEPAFGIGKAELGWVLTVSALVGALATLPFGWLVDRVNRTRMLAIAVVLWAISMAVLACATSYAFLLATRAAIGAVLAVSGPATASLVGDWFEPARRGRVWGAILAGELVGAGFGFVIAGQLAVISWRIGIASLVFPALLVAWLVHRLPEPARGGESRIAEGQEELGERHAPRTRAPDASMHAGTRLVREKVREQHIAPREQLVLDDDPSEKSLWWAAWYVLRVPTNVVLIVASALGYYFFTGARAFGVQLFEAHFGLGHTGAIWFIVGLGLAGIGGVVIGGFSSDRLLARGHVTARPWVASVAYMTSAACFFVTLLVPSLALAVAPFLLASAALGAMNPPLDAARLDIMHPRMWGRAESVRMFFRRAGEGVAPVLFGYVAGDVFDGSGQALRDTFLIMTVPFFLSGLVSLVSVKTYPRDVATADAYAKRTSDGDA